MIKLFKKEKKKEKVEIKEVKEEAKEEVKEEEIKSPSAEMARKIQELMRK